jgi:hypothetical protein
MSEFHQARSTLISLFSMRTLELHRRKNCLARSDPLKPKQSGTQFELAIEAHFGVKLDNLFTK